MLSGFASDGLPSEMSDDYMAFIKSVKGTVCRLLPSKHASQPLKSTPFATRAAVIWLADFMCWLELEHKINLTDTPADADTSNDSRSGTHLHLLEFSDYIVDIHNVSDFQPKEGDNSDCVDTILHDGLLKLVKLGSSHVPQLKCIIYNWSLEVSVSLILICDLRNVVRDVAWKTSNALLGQKPNDLNTLLMLKPWLRLDNQDS